MIVNNHNLEIGDKLYGFCGGAFGSSHFYSESIIEQIGQDWIVVRTSDNKVHFACDDTREDGWKVSKLLEYSRATDPRVLDYKGKRI